MGSSPTGRCSWPKPRHTFDAHADHRKRALQAFPSRAPRGARRDGARPRAQRRRRRRRVEWARAQLVAVLGQNHGILLTHMPTTESARSRRSRRVLLAELAVTALGLLVPARARGQAIAEFLVVVH